MPISRPCPSDNFFRFRYAPLPLFTKIGNVFFLPFPGPVRQVIFFLFLPRLHTLQYDANRFFVPVHQTISLSDRISKKRRLNMFFSEKIRVQTACLEKTPFARVLLEKVLKKTRTNGVFFQSPWLTAFQRRIFLTCSNGVSLTPTGGRG